MKSDREFQLRQMAWNDTSYPICCLILGGIQAALLVAYFWSQRPGIPTLNRGYLYFFCIALAGAAGFYLLDRCLRRRVRLRQYVRFTALIGCLLWAGLFSAVELRQGHGTHGFAQMLMFLSACFRIPSGLHCAVNTAVFGVSVLILRLMAPDVDVFYDELANNAIYLAISCTVVISSNRIRYMAYRADKESERAQNAQMDAMAEQVEKVRELVEQSRILRHDMRHYALAVEQGLDSGDFGSIRALTRELNGALDSLAAKRPLRKITGLAEVDAVVSRYMEWAEREGVSFQTELEPPVGIEPRDFTLLLMNALENACIAVKKIPPAGERYIRLTGEGYRGQYYLELVNACPPGGVTISRTTGLPVSDRPGHGYGVKSMATVLEWHHAYYRFQERDGTFRFQMLLASEEGVTPGPAPTVGRTDN